MPGKIPLTDFEAHPTSISGILNMKQQISSGAPIGLTTSEMLLKITDSQKYFGEKRLALWWKSLFFVLCQIGS